MNQFGKSQTVSYSRIGQLKKNNNMHFKFFEKWHCSVIFQNELTKKIERQKKKNHSFVCKTKYVCAKNCKTNLKVVFALMFHTH